METEGAPEESELRGKHRLRRLVLGAACLPFLFLAAWFGTEVMGEPDRDLARPIAWALAPFRSSAVR
jgi:hypothetical protein